MNRKLIGLTAVSMAFLSGCAPNAKNQVNAVQNTVSGHVGSPVRWLRDPADFAEAEATVAVLLKEPLTVDSAVQIALLSNRSLQAEMEEIGIARAELVQTGLLRNPEFSASWRFPDRPPSAANTEYSLTGELLDLVFLPYRKRIAAQGLQQAQFRVAHSILSLAHEVKTAFYQIQAEEQLLARLKQIEEVNEAAADLAKRQHDAGNITDLELANQQAVHSQSRISAAQTERELRRDQQQFNRLLGLWGGHANWKISGQLPEIPKEEIAFENLESLAMSQRHDLAALKRNADTLYGALSLKTKTRFSPGGVRVGVDTERDPSRTRVTGPTLSLELPIFDRGQGAIARLGAQYRMAQRALEALAVSVRADVSTAIDAVIASRDLAEFHRAVALPQRVKIVRETLLQYNAMQKPTYELLAAKERELEAERQYVEAWRDYWIARADLEQAIGGKLNLAEARPTTTNPPAAATPSPEHHHQP